MNDLIIHWSHSGSRMPIAISNLLKDYSDAYKVLVNEYNANVIQNYVNKTTTIAFDNTSDYMRFMLEWS